VQPRGQQLSAQGPRTSGRASPFRCTPTSLAPTSPVRAAGWASRSAHRPTRGQFQTFQPVRRPLAAAGFAACPGCAGCRLLVSRAAGCLFRNWTLYPSQAADRARRRHRRRQAAKAVHGKGRQCIGQASFMQAPRSLGREWLAGRGHCRLQRRRPAPGSHSLQPAPPVPPWPAHRLRRPAPAIRRRYAPGG
jgi:hypothetical protein